VDQLEEKEQTNKAEDGAEKASYGTVKALPSWLLVAARPSRGGHRDGLTVTGAVTVTVIR
jgi:hypothetical protein